jgi:hypothetical protein
MKSMLISLIFVASIATQAADIPLAWDLPVTNYNGSPVTDLVVTRINWAPATMTVTAWTNVTWAVGKVTNTVKTIAAWEIRPGSPTNSMRVPASTNSPTGTVTDMCVITNVATGVYIIWGNAINAYGAESTNSEWLITPSGSPSTIKFKK